ncbi:polynucleotide adenylyltransferase [Halomonas sp. TP35]
MVTHSNDPRIVGLDVYRVGGAVRDALLGWPVYDNDWVVVGATPAAMRQRGFKPVGRDFPVFLHPDTAEEYALARTERKTGHGYSGFEVHASPEVTLEEDLLRRDLTVNAIAQRVDGPLIDPFDGQGDIEKRILRHISCAFGEDPLRVLRTARFLARYASLGFSIASETLALMTEVSRSGELEHLAAERVWVETEKALGEPSPEAYFTTLAQCEALAIWWPFSAEKLQDGLAALQYVPDDSPTLLAHWRYALLVSVLDDVGREALAEKLRLPNAVTQLARHVALTLSLLKEPLEAVAVLHWLERLDGFRKPDQVATQLTLVSVVESVGVVESGGVIESDYAQPLQAAWLAARSVSPQGLIAQGFKGAGLGQALREQRQQAVSDALSG